MEGLLPANGRICDVCCEAFKFKLSRFGGIFVCCCGRRQDLLKVIHGYGEELRRGCNTRLGFVPCIDSPTVHGTSTVKVVAVELNFEEQAVDTVFHNFPVNEIRAAFELLPLCVKEQGALVGGNMIRFAWGLVDTLVEELQAVASGAVWERRFFVNAPALPLLHELPEVARMCSSTRADLMAQIPHQLRSVLRRHQLEGVDKVLSFNGRALIADDMGVGKTLEALAVVGALRAYPLLIVCPSALKYMWVEEVEKYLHLHVSVHDIHLVNGCNDALAVGDTPKVVIASYHMAAVLRAQLLERDWKCLVCDESHLLHTNVGGSDALYTRVLCEVGRRAKYCMFLTGTPALNSPFDMYNQVNTLLPGCLGGSRWHFALRYCHIHLTPYLKILECVRPVEYASFLREFCMIRRLKIDVLDLPCKSRVVLRVSGNCSSVEYKAGSIQIFQEQYSKAWRQKQRGILEVIDYCCQKYNSFVCFAHHLHLIDTLEAFLRRRKVSFIRIDGRVAPQLRDDLLRQFQDGAKRVALVGITACAVGISLATAPCAVFCELPPDAAWMSQAEDRLHRPGQRQEVTVLYLIGAHCVFDVEHFSRLWSSYNCTHRIIDNSDLAFSFGSVARAGVGTTEHSGEGVELPASVLCAPAPPLDPPFMFTVSKNTGRIHVKSGCHEEASGYYVSFSPSEATECVRLRSDPVWEALSHFMDSFDSHSPFYRRQIVLRGVWLPSKFRWKEQIHVVSGSFSRYQKLPVSLGWGFWWVIRRHYFPSRQYFGFLGWYDGFKPRCLNCGAIQAAHATMAPGALAEVDDDTVLFCDGQCRRDFYIKRSGGALRRNIAAADSGVCANCHVDCERLCAVAASCLTKREREETVRRCHPQLLEFPNLFRNFVQNPIPGNCWHADHVVAVALGGGESSLENVQTLCIACHAHKTREDIHAVKRLQNRTTTSRVDPVTTVDAAAGILRSGGVTRSRATHRKL